ncbi:MAG: DsrE family protein [Nitrospirota bacterium]|nr:DsrE family protein [Nitrospirota bacterium]
MKLGILVNTNKQANNLIGLTKAALSKGHEVIVFFMDDGVKLLSNKKVTSLCNNSNISMSFCDYTTQKNGISKEGICDKIVCGSQYDNATMNHEADRVIVL